MPLPNDEKLLTLSRDILQQFDALFGLHPGFRPAHARGVLVTGRFNPAAEAGAFCRATHLQRSSTPVTARFSNSTGLPLLPDNDPNADPRGLAIRFHLGEHDHTDLVAHSTDGFPARNGPEFLDFLRAVATHDPANLAQSKLPAFLEAHPAAQAFVTTPKPAPSSFAREAYFLVSAFRFTNRENVSCYGRIRITPVAGVEHLDEPTAKSQTSSYLFDELKQRLAAGPIEFDIVVQMADDGDPVDDSSAHWPEDRKVVPFGRVTLESLVPDDLAHQKKIIYDPVPRLDGIAPSADPLLEVRSAIYLMSGRRRRQA